MNESGCRAFSMSSHGKQYIYKIGSTLVIIKYSKWRLLKMNSKNDF